MRLDKDFVCEAVRDMRLTVVTFKEESRFTIIRLRDESVADLKESYRVFALEPKRLKNSQPYAVRKLIRSTAAKMFSVPVDVANPRVQTP